MTNKRRRQTIALFVQNNHLNVECTWPQTPPHTSTDTRAASRFLLNIIIIMNDDEIYEMKSIDDEITLAEHAFRIRHSYIDLRSAPRQQQEKNQSIFSIDWLCLRYLYEWAGHENGHLRF